MSNKLLDKEVIGGMHIPDIAKLYNIDEHMVRRILAPTGTWIGWYENYTEWFLKTHTKLGKVLE